MRWTLLVFLIAFCILSGENLSGQALIKLYEKSDLEKFTRMVREKPDLVFDQDKDGCNIIHTLCGSSSAEVKVYLKAIFDNVPDIDVDNMYCDGSTPLEFAIVSDNIGIIKMLVGKGADINKMDRDSATYPLLIALAASTVGTVEYLLSLKPVVRASNSKGITPLMAACFRGHKGIVDKIISLGSGLTAIDRQGNTALNYACNRSLLSFKYSPNPELVKMLLSSGLNVNNKNDNGVTPLMSAMASSSSELILLLINSGAKTNDRDNEGTTPLMYAAGNGQWDVFEALLKMGAEIDASDNDGKTALLYAVATGDIMSVEKMVKSGAKTSVVDNYGHNALDYAKEYKYDNIVKYLKPFFK
jgi:ankyrin repeat protein